MILLIDNYDSFSYNLYQLLGELNPDIRVIRNDELTVDEIQALHPSHILLSPGPGRPEDAGIIIEVVRKLGPKVPILGVCLGHQAICGRLGGDEFICFVYGSSSHEELEHRIDNLKAQRGRSFYSVHHPNMAYTVEFSVGISFYPQESMDFHALMRIADQKMYEEKKQRKLDGVLHTDNIERMSPQ